MTTLSNPNPFATDFSHRLNAQLNSSPCKLHDCLNPVLERVEAIADLMEIVFERGEESNVRHLWRAAQVIRMEALDAQAILNAYYEGSRTPNVRPQTESAKLARIHSPEMD